MPVCESHSDHRELGLGDILVGPEDPAGVTLDDTQGGQSVDGGAHHTSSSTSEKAAVTAPLFQQQVAEHLCRLAPGHLSVRAEGTVR